VGVEKLDLSKLVEKSLRQDAPQTNFSVFKTFCVPQFWLFGRKLDFFNTHNAITLKAAQG
jgi:hypothetical protein